MFSLQDENPTATSPVVRRWGKQAGPGDGSPCSDPVCVEEGTRGWRVRGDWNNADPKHQGGASWTSDPGIAGAGVIFQIFSDSIMQAPTGFWEHTLGGPGWVRCPTCFAQIVGNQGS